MTTRNDLTVTAGQVIRVRLPDGRLVEGTVAQRSKTKIEINGDVNGMSVGDEVMATILLPHDTNRTFQARVNHVDTANKLWHIEVIEEPNRYHAPRG